MYVTPEFAAACGHLTTDQLDDLQTVCARRPDAARILRSFVRAAVANGDAAALRFHRGVGVWLTDGTDVPALAIFADALGNWTMLRASDLAVVQYLADEVR